MCSRASISGSFWILFDTSGPLFLFIFLAFAFGSRVARATCLGSKPSHASPASPHVRLCRCGSQPPNLDQSSSRPRPRTRRTHVTAQRPLCLWPLVSDRAPSSRSRGLPGTGADSDNGPGHGDSDSDSSGATHPRTAICERCNCVVYFLDQWMQWTMGSANTTGPTVVSLLHMRMLTLTFPHMLMLLCSFPRLCSRSRTCAAQHPAGRVHRSRPHITMHLRTGGLVDHLVRSG